jgi:hypothetical protein
MERIHMGTKFKFPVSLPRWTKEEFDQKRREYTAEHGYEIHVPGWSDIFHLDFTREPSAEEIQLYKNRDIDALGEKRYNKIQELMAKKRERFLRLLKSPTPRIAMNAASCLTFLDDINDTVGTLGVVARTAAHVLPKTAGKLLTGPAGWLFTASDVTNVVMALCRMPWKAKRLQHDLHRALRLQPVTKKNRLSRLNKLKRLKLSKGEAIEALQTTDNVFGIGISLGPIMGLLYDVPSGIYRAIKGEEVKVTGLPAPCYWVDRVVTNAMGSIAQLFYGNPDFDDEERAQAMYAMNYMTQWQKALAGDKSPLDFVDEPAGVEIAARTPQNPSTIEVIQSEVGDIDQYTGWPCTGGKWMGINEMIDNHLDEIQDNIHAWEERNKTDIVANVAMQNACEAGLNSLALLEGDDAVESEFTALASAYLKLLNNGLRLPLDATQQQLDCFTKSISAHDLEPNPLTLGQILDIARIQCNLTFTTEVPERNTQQDYILDVEAREGIERLREWYYYEVTKAAYSLTFGLERNRPDFREPIINVAKPRCQWLNRYGFPKDPPKSSIALLSPERRALVLDQMRELGCKV